MNLRKTNIFFYIRIQALLTESHPKKNQCWWFVVKITYHRPHNCINYIIPFPLRVASKWIEIHCQIELNSSVTMIFGNESEVVCSQAITTKKRSHFLPHYNHWPLVNSSTNLYSAWVHGTNRLMVSAWSVFGLQRWWWGCQPPWGWRLFLFLPLPAWTYCYFESWGVPSCFLAAFCCYLSDEFEFFWGACWRESGVLKRNWSFLIV